jgi:hypothetical protein
MQESVQSMKMLAGALLLTGAILLAVARLDARQTKSAGAADGNSPPVPSSQAQSPRPAENPQSYSGTYTFLNEGEFLQVTVEDDHRVTGFISRFEESENAKGGFLDQFFKTGQVAGNKLTFSTQTVHGVAFDFKGSVERGDGKNPGDEGYFQLQGTLTISTTDANKKVTSKSREVVFRLFPKDAAPTAQFGRWKTTGRRAPA